MLKITINGKPVRPADLEKELLRAAAKRVGEEMRDRLGSIRHPDTGEFPSIVVEGDALDDLRLRIEGSASLLEIVKARLTPEDEEKMTYVANDAQTPKAFLSYGWDDRALAEKIATGLQKHGIETWWAEWEIRGGDSIRRKIDSGLVDCTHFIVLLTPTSIGRPWVNEEIDAGFVQKVRQQSRFIPLRYALSHDALPPLLSGMLSPEVDEDASNLLELIHDIHGISRKPLLGAAPSVALTPKSEYSAGATAVAGVFVARSENGTFGDPQLRIEELGALPGLSPDETTDAVYELRYRLRKAVDTIMPEDSLFSEFDRLWQPWNPSVDASTLAAGLVNDPEHPDKCSEIATRYDWPARRLNPAISYLAERNAIQLIRTLGCRPFVGAFVKKTDATRRFVKSRS